MKRYLFKYTDNDTKQSFNAVIEAPDKEAAYYYWKEAYLSEKCVVDNIIDL
jgi:hypothetical protein